MSHTVTSFEQKSHYREFSVGSVQEFHAPRSRKRGRRRSVYAEDPTLVVHVQLQKTEDETYVSPLQRCVETDGGQKRRHRNSSSSSKIVQEFLAPQTKRMRTSYSDSSPVSHTVQSQRREESASTRRSDAKTLDGIWLKQVHQESKYSLFSDAHNRAHRPSRLCNAKKFRLRTKRRRHPREGLRYSRYVSQSNASIPDNRERQEEDKSETKQGTKIWIIGSGYVCYGERAACEIFGENVGLNAKVEWFGLKGMCWSGVLSHFYCKLSSMSPPNILVVHAGGNDLGQVSAEKLAGAMQKDLMQLRKEFPSMTIAFSCINEQRVWHYGQPWRIEKDRKTVNSMMTKAVHMFGGEVIEHPDLRFYKKSLYLRDGVHFTERGNRVFLSSVHDVLEKILNASPGISLKFSRLSL